MQEIRYLIDTYCSDEVTELEEEASSLDQSKVKKQTVYLHDINITALNMSRIIREFHTISLTPHNQF